MNKTLFWIIVVSIIVRLPILFNLSEGILLGNDGYIFYRYASYDSIPEIDSLRYFPRGFETNQELLLTSYAVKLLSVFWSGGLYYASLIYPVFFTMISFIFLFKFLEAHFNKRVALWSLLFLALIPAYLFRTSPGFLDKEPLAMFFFFGLLYWIKKSNYLMIFLFNTGLIMTWSGSMFFLACLGTGLIFNFIRSGREFNFLTLVLLASISLSIGLTPRYSYMSLGFLPIIFYFFFVKISKFIRMERFFLLLFLITVVFAVMPNLFGIILDRFFNPLGSDSFSFSISENKSPGFLELFRNFNFLWLFIVPGGMLFLRKRGLFSYVFLVWFFVGLFASFKSYRFMFIWSPVACIFSAVFLVWFENWFSKFYGSKLLSRLLIGVFLIIFILYNFVVSAVSNFGFSTYFDDDWLNSCYWISNNTSYDSVVLASWSYGYFVQNFANRSTILDGGNYYGDLNEWFFDFVYSVDEESALSVLSLLSDPDFLILDQSDVYLLDNNSFIYLAYFGGSDLFRLVYESGGIRVFNIDYFQD